MEKKTIRKDVFASYRQEPSGSYLMANRGLLNPPYHQTLLSISFHRNEIESFACVRSLFLSPFSLSLSLSLSLPLSLPHPLPHRFPEYIYIYSSIESQ